MDIQDYWKSQIPWPLLVWSSASCSKEHVVTGSMHNRCLGFKSSFLLTIYFKLFRQSCYMMIHATWIMSSRRGCRGVPKNPSVNSRRLKALRKRPTWSSEGRVGKGDSSSVTLTDYSKLIDDVGIRRDHSLLIRSTRSLRERDYRTDADLKRL